MGLDLALYRALRSVDVPEDKAMAVVEALETHIQAQRTAKPGPAQRQLDTQQVVTQHQLDIQQVVAPPST